MQLPRTREQQNSVYFFFFYNSTVLFYQELDTYCIPLLLLYCYIPSGPWHPNSSEFLTLLKGSSPAAQWSAKAITIQWQPFVETTHLYQLYCKAVTKPSQSRRGAITKLLQPVDLMARYGCNTSIEAEPLQCVQYWIVLQQECCVSYQLKKAQILINYKVKAWY